jgi:hypothetical protein
MVLVKELIEAVTIHADWLEVTVTEAPRQLSDLVRSDCGTPVRDLLCRRREPPLGTHRLLENWAAASTYFLPVATIQGCSR